MTYGVQIKPYFISVETNENPLFYITIVVKLNILTFQMQSGIMLFAVLEILPTTGTNINTGKHNLTSLQQLVKSSQEVNLSTWDNVGATLENNNNTEEALQNEDNISLASYGLPIVWGIIFLIGIVGNGTLLLIFTLNPSMRTKSNACLFNLVISDILSLLLNLPLNYVDHLSNEWYLGIIMCKIFWLSRDLTIGTSVFSVTVLSLQRYWATVGVFQKQYDCFLLSGRIKTFLLILSIWILALCCSIPLATKAQIHEICVLSKGNEMYIRNMITFHFFAFCIIPLIIITYCHIAIARHMVISAHNMPGEMTQCHAIMQTAARLKGAKIILGLTVVFFISYFPNYVWIMTFFWGKLEYTHQAYIYLDFVTYSLLFTNSCLNPIALYCCSNTFRSYFNQYLFCFQSRIKNKITTSTTKTAFTQISHIPQQHMERRKEERMTDTINCKEDKALITSGISR